MDQNETLREALLDLDRARAKAERLHRQSEALLAGLRVLSQVKTDEEIYEGMLRVLKDVLGFEDAVVLVADDQGIFRARATTTDRLGRIEWQASAMTQRAMTRPVAAFDIGRIEEWNPQPPEVTRNVISALHFGMRTENSEALLICTHPDRGYFRKEHILVAERFGSFATQAINDAERRATLVAQNRFFGLSLEIMAILDYSGAFLQVNAAWESTFGVQADDLLRTNFYELVIKEDREATQRAIQPIIRGEQSLIEIDNQLQRADGEHRRICWRCAGVEGEDLLYVVGRDVTERHALKQDLVHASAVAEAANQAKSHFLANMSHDLRTPLNGILGICEAFQLGVYGSLNDIQQESIRNIEHAGRHQLDIVNDLLDISKIEAGVFKPVMEPFSLVALSNELIDLMRPRAQQHQLEMALMVDEGVDHIVSDRRRLRQMLLNLLSNALKFTPQGGTVGLDLHSGASGVTLAVWDTGIGISRDDLSRVLEPFVQLDSTLSRKHTGTGLGLSLTSKFAVMLGGRLEIDSRLGRGSRFTVHLPLAPPEFSKPSTTPPPGKGAESPPEIVSITPTEGKHVLLVDDTPSNLTHVRDFLIKKGHRVSIAYSGSDALVLARELPDIVFMDVQMPGMDGIEAIQRLRADPLTRDLWIVSLTALAMNEDRDRCMQAGANAYLSKPIPLREILAAVEGAQT